jgi:hypothetical protein
MAKNSNALTPVAVTIEPANLTFDKQDIVNIGIVEVEQKLQAEFDNLVASLEPSFDRVRKVVKDFNSTGLAP